MKFKYESSIPLNEGAIENKPAAQAAGQTLPDATPPVGKIHPFCKVVATFEPIQRFRRPSRFRFSYIHTYKHTYKRTYKRTYALTYIRTYMQMYIQTYIQTYAN